LIQVTSSILIIATRERCFDLARDMKTHAETMRQSNERIVSAPESGVLRLGDEVTFEAVHFGIRQRLTSKIVEFDRPDSFTDEMQKGAFKSLRHTHQFVAESAGTKMIDTLEIEAPLGPLGWIAERVFLRRYMKQLIEQRGRELKQLVENANEVR
jgi:ligand-binding SRPBCC domain-containing protein